MMGAGLTERSEEETLRKVADGDLVEFEILCRRHATKLCNFAYRLLLNWNDAEDVVQETLFRVFKSGLDGTFDTEPAIFRRFIYRTVSNLCMNKMRHQRETVSLEKQTVDSSRAAKRERFQNGTDDALVKLNPNQRAAVLLKDYNGLRYVEIANVLNRSVPQVKIMVYRARKWITGLMCGGEQSTTDETIQCDVAREDISAYLDGELSGIDAARVEAHLKKCGDCNREMGLLGKGSKLVAEVDERRPSPELGAILKRRSRDYLDGFLATRRRSRMARAAQVWAYRAIAGSFIVAVCAAGVYIVGRLSSDRQMDVRRTRRAAPAVQPPSAERKPGASPAETERATTSVGVHERLATAAAKVQESEYSGWWDVSCGSPPRDIGFVKLVRDSTTISILGDAYVSGLGTVEGRRMVIARADSRKQEMFELEAEFDVAGRSFAGTATASYNGEGYEYHVAIFGEKVSRELATILESEDGAIETTTKRENRIKKVYAALGKYSEEHGGALPDELSELIPDYLDKRSLVVGEPGVREIAYAGSLSIPSRGNGTDLYEESSEQRLEAFFTQLVSESWRIAPCGRAILYLDGTTAWDDDPESVPALPQELVEHRAKERMLRCQNNMKRLGAVLEKWLDESEGRYPPSLGMLYPRFLSDLRTLTCPEARPHTVSYEFVCFGETKPAEEEFGSADAAAEYYVATPVAVETGEPHFGGHNVLYMDGHTEWHPASERYW